MSEHGVDSLSSHPIDPESVLWNIPPAERIGKPLLVMMHGLGSHEGDLFGLNRFLPSDLAVASLRAPLDYGGGFAWFPPGAQSPRSDTRQLDASVNGVLDWISTLDSAPSTIGLMGFSQGGCMALQLIREAPDRFDFVVQLSGFIAPAPHPGDAVLSDRSPRLPVFWGHGDDDQVIAPSTVERTGEWLTAHADVEAHRYSMAHSVSQEELADLVEFVGRKLDSANPA